MILSARNAQTIDEIFHPDFGRAIRGICQSVSPDTQIVNAPGFHLRLRGLDVQGYTLFAQAHEGGLRRFTIRFRRVDGQALALVKLGQPEQAASGGRGASLPRIDGRVSPDRLFDEMLAHLYLPLVNLNAYLKAVIDGQRVCPGEQVSVSAAQLRARSEVLQFAFDRMISELMVVRAADQGASQDRGYGSSAPACESLAARSLEARVA